jgi:hypothetical protein
MFVREGILDPLSSSLLSILRDESLGIAHESVTRSINVLLLFSQVSQADSRVREAFASRTVIIRTFSILIVLTNRTVESLRETARNERRAGGCTGTHPGEITGHCSQGYQAPCCFSATDRGTPKLECHGGLGLATWQDYERGQKSGKCTQSVE